MPGSRTAAWCLILAMLLAPVPGRAGETIADPANESVGGESDDPGDGDRSAESGTAGGDDTDDGTREEDDTGETIVDPANRSGGDTGRAPAAQAGADRRSAETGSGNESSGAGDAVDVRGDWSSSLSIDADWSEPGEDIVELHSSIGLALDHQLSSRTRVSIAGSVRHWVAGKRVPGGPNYLFNARQPRAAFEARLGESYLLHRTDRWSFRVGHLLVPWGRTELIRPGAVINGRDLSSAAAIGTSGGAAALPRFGFEGGWVGPDWSAKVVLMPFFAPDRVWLFGRDTALSHWGDRRIGGRMALESLAARVFDRSQYEELQGVLRSTSVPDERPKNVSAGVRVSGTVENTDLGLAYFFGWDRTPSVSVDGDLRAPFGPTGGGAGEGDGRDVSVGGEQLFTTAYRRRHTVLIDAARYVGPIGVRTDLTFSPERTFVTESLRTVRRPTFFGALGLSWERLIDGHPLGVTVEGFWLRPFGRDSALTELFVARGERGPAGTELAYVGSGLFGVAGAVDWEMPWADLGLTLGGLSDLSSGDLVMTGLVHRRWESWLRTGVGYRLFEGPSPDRDLSVGGVYDPNDQFVVTVDGSF